VENLKLADRFDLEHSAYFTYRYEDFLAGNLTALENYLGHSFHFLAALDQEFVRVRAANGRAIGRDWFTVTIYSILSDPRGFLIKHGYDTVWSLHSAPAICRAFYRYVRRLF